MSIPTALFQPLLKVLCYLLLTLSLQGCSYFISSASSNFGEKLSQVILDNEDPNLVAEAIPSYLLLLETMLKDSPDDAKLLSATAKLYSAYINFLPTDAKNIPLLSIKAMNYGAKAACLQNSDLCQLNKLTFKQFSSNIENTSQDDLTSLYILGSSWAGWIKAHKQDWNAIAQLAQVNSIMKRIIELDESYQGGAAHTYLGVMATLVPPALGGNPDTAVYHFEQALSLSKQNNLMFKVLYARHYARMMFDQNLHDRLLTEVIQANPQQEGLTLSNTLAQQQAKKLLKSAADYF